MTRLRPAVLWLLMCGAAAAVADDDRDYGLDYRATFTPDRGSVAVRIDVTQSRQRLVTLDFNAPASRYAGFAGDGAVTRDGDRVIWEVPAEGGAVSYRTRVDHRRGGAYDARMTADWAVVRLDDLFPPVSARSKVSSHARTRLYLVGPANWSFETRYGPVGRNGVAVDTRGRRFDRPLGWLAAGDLGIRRTRIGDRRIAIAGPRNQGLRRMDILVFLRWTLPELVRIAPTFPRRLLVVGAGDDMWRGGLSGPGSLYLHPSRPLVSGNATSTLLHELMHVATEEPPAAGADWIVEGMAEYYSLVVLTRTGAIRGRRLQRAFEDLREWVEKEDGRLADPSTGADTARAVLVFRDLDLELRAAGSSLDTVAGDLLGERISLERLRRLSRAQLGHASRVLADVEADRRPGGVDQ